MAEEEHKPAPNVVWTPWAGGQTKFITCPIREIFAEGNRGGGKALANNQPVLTDNGWISAGEVTQRHRLVAPDGTYTNIRGIYKQEPKEHYQVMTEGGASVIACGEHRWSTYSGKNGSRDGWQVRTTDELRKLKGDYYLPLMSAPVPGKQWEGIDPYIAGYILGDGCLTGKHVVIYTVDEHTIEYLTKRGWKHYNYDSQNTHMISETRTDLKKQWRELLGRCSGRDKRIPYSLLMSDPQTRLALLRGLMDSDGSVETGKGTSASPGGQCSFVNTSKHLAEGVQYLVRSLGGKARVRWKDKHSGKGGSIHGYWHVSITLANKFNPFLMPRKAELVREQKGVRDKIVSIDPVGLREGVCFAVDHPSHLFVTKDFIVTHNTDTLLMKYLRYVDAGFGSAWTGIIFRRKYKHLDDIVKKSKRWIPQIFPGARWLASKSDYKWVFPNGEELLFRAMKDPEDYNSYHGHEYPFIGWEELTNWPTDICYDVMFSCNRCSVAGVPRHYLSSGNPFGAGHSWVKERFIDIGPEGTVVDDGEENLRVRINVDLEDNLTMMKNDPAYAKNLDGIKNEELKKAWRYGDWGIVVGGFLQGIWDRQRHVVKPFMPPLDWPRWRAMDWGFAKPYSVGWFAISPEGIIYLYRELYGYGGKADTGTRESGTEVALKIKKIEAKEIKAGAKFRRNPADTNLWQGTGTEKTVHDLFKAKSVRWVKAQKGPGSRVTGAALVVDALKHDKFKVTEDCTHWLRTVPVLMPNESNWEDVDTEMEDHAWDMTMYSLRSRHKVIDPEHIDKGPKVGTFDWLMKVSKETRTERVL